MSWDVLSGKNDGRDWARGEPPPAHSIEWAGIPQSAANMMARSGSSGASSMAGTGIATTSSTEKPRTWLWALGSFVAGTIIGSLGEKD